MVRAKEVGRLSRRLSPTLATLAKALKVAGGLAASCTGRICVTELQLCLTPELRTSPLFLASLAGGKRSGALCSMLDARPKPSSHEKLEFTFGSGPRRQFAM